MQAAQLAPAPAAIEVNGVEIPETAIARELQHHPAESLAAARRKAVEALVIRELLVQEARRRGFATEEADLPDDPAIAALLEAEVICPEADADTCRRYFDNNPTLFRSPDLFEARHILIAAAPEDEDARGTAKQQAAAIIARLQAEPHLFTEMARQYSACPSKSDGGNLGQLARGDTVPEFETYLFSLHPGELCPVPIETRYGVHVIQLDRKALGVPLGFDDVHDRIAEYLKARSFHTAVRQYLLLLAGQAEIKGFEMEAAHSPLVQ
ncbi:MAG: peptidylprolyl isomerase [Rhodospirillaceae bacterium]|nr:peptidylprolyl isomerase [Rhodospirillaceae bacterium]